MLTPGMDEYERKGKERFERCFIERIKDNQKLNITFEWDSNESDPLKYKIHVNGIKIFMNSIGWDKFSDFGSGGPKEFRDSFLDQTENEFMDKLKNYNKP